jgi:hypothetical protein
MRSIVWMGGKKPDNMTDLQYELNAQQLAKHVNGELVKFGETNFVIIGDQFSEIAMKNLQKKHDSKPQTA